VNISAPTPGKAANGQRIRRAPAFGAAVAHRWDTNPHHLVPTTLELIRYHFNDDLIV
jgi:hypothetical protein